MSGRGTLRLRRTSGPLEGSMPVTVSDFQAKRISPKLVTADLPQTIAFYTDVLGFTVSRSFPEYVILDRDGCTIHFGVAASEEVMRCVRGQTEIYLEVVGIQPLWRHVEAFKHRFRIRDLFAREYGMNEFHIEDPNGCLIFVGEPTGS